MTRMNESAEAPAPRLVLVEIEDGVAVLTLNRPEVRNALSSALLGELRRTLAGLDEDDSVRAVILTGSDPAFCAGLDLKELSERADSSLLEDPSASEDIPTGRPWRPLGKPVIGAVNGVAVTGGFELALNCDFLIASERAAFADTHTRVGVLPGWGLSVLLPQLVGFGLARRLSYTGDYLPAAEAWRAGLVTEVVPHDELLPTARRVAASIAANNTSAVNTMVASYRDIEAAAQGEGLDIEATTSIEWRRAGGSRGLSDRVTGVFARGRAQIAGGSTE
jgi:enoyl-CoA hydratase/carnithine racemase